MSERKYYSLAIRPSDEVIAQVSDMRAKLGGAALLEPEASVGVMEFEAFEHELPVFEQYVASFVASRLAQEMEFTIIDTLSASPGRENGVLYFSASRNSQQSVKIMFEELYAGFPMKDHVWMYRYPKPQIAIAKGLSKAKLLVGKQYFANLKSLRYSFTADAILLKEFDGKLRDFRQIGSYSFAAVGVAG